MITHDILLICFANLSEKQITDALDNDHHYVHMYIEGNHGYILLHALDMNDADDVETITIGCVAGGLVCDKDEFIELYKNTDVTNEHLEKYV